MMLMIMITFYMKNSDMINNLNRKYNLLQIDCI